MKHVIIIVDIKWIYQLLHHQLCGLNQVEIKRKEKEINFVKPFAKLHSKQRKEKILVINDHYFNHYDLPWICNF